MTPNLPATSMHPNVVHPPGEYARPPSDTLTWPALIVSPWARGMSRYMAL